MVQTDGAVAAVLVVVPEHSTPDADERVQVPLSGVSDVDVTLAVVPELTDGYD